MRARLAPLLVGVVLLVSGLVWIGQGLNVGFAPRSFMTADRLWVFIGAVTAIAGAVIVGRSRTRV